MKEILKLLTVSCKLIQFFSAKKHISLTLPAYACIVYCVCDKVTARCPLDGFGVATVLKVTV